MPIIAIGVAVAADVGATAAVASAAAFTVTTALEVTAAVGATVSAVGAVTGNKTLETVGAGIGLVGGIGSLASGAGLFGDAANTDSIFGSSASSASAASGASSASAINTTSDPWDTGNDMLNNLTGGSSSGGAGTSAASSGVSDFSDNAADAVAPTDYASAPPEATGAAADSASQSQISGFSDSPAPQTDASTGLINSSGAPGNAPNLAANQPGTTPTGAPPSPYAPGSGGTGTSLPGTPAPASPTTPTVGAPSATSLLNAPASNYNLQPGSTSIIDPNSSANWGSTPGFFGNIVNFAKANPLLASGALTAVGSFATGIGNELSGLTPAQISQANAQAAENQAQANLTTQQTQNLAQPKAAATLGAQPANPAPLIQGYGLINAA